MRECDAPQYGLDSLIVVFGVGMAMGWLRLRTNTVAAVIAHALYDLVLMSVVLLAS